MADLLTMYFGSTGMYVHWIRSKALLYAFTIQDGRTPLLLAAERGHTDLVRQLAGHYEGDIFHKMKVYG